MPKFVLIGLKNFKSKDKIYNQAIIKDDDSNIITVFITNEVYDFLKNYMYKEITSLCYLVYDRNTGFYRISIEK